MRMQPSLGRSVAALCLSATVMVGLQACADESGPPVYGPYAQGMVARVAEGTVVSFRPIQFGPGDTTGATVAGGVGGAIIGSALSSWRDQGLGMVLGGIGGALVGNAVANSNRHPGFAYLIRMNNGRDIEIAQADPQPIPVGARVSVSFYGPRARVTPLGAPAYGPPPPPPRAVVPPPPPPAG